MHIRINNPALNCTTGKNYIPEIFNCLLGADKSSNESDQTLDTAPTWLHSSHHSKQQVLQSSVFGKLSNMGITTHSAGILPVTNCQVSGPSIQSTNSFIGDKEVPYSSRICSQRSIHTLPRCEASK